MKEEGIESVFWTLLIYIVSGSNHHWCNEACQSVSEKKNRDAHKKEQKLMFVIQNATEFILYRDLLT